MSATIGVRELPKSGRKGPGIGLVIAAVVAAGLVGGALILRSGTTSPAPATSKVVTIQTSTLPAWQVKAEQAGYTGRLGAVAPAAPAETTAISEAAWLTTAKEAGFKGFGNGTTQSTPKATSPVRDWDSQQALRAAR